jgi:hypothetical protein
MRLEELIPKGWKPHSVHWLPTGVVYIRLINASYQQVIGAGATFEEAFDQAIREAAAW